MELQRSSGIVLHPTSLPGGTLGDEAYAFVDWLAAAGQSWWQVLPLGPPDDVGSPYASSSAFAAWNGFLAQPDAPVSARELAAYRARERLLDRGLGARGRERGRPGSVRPRMVGAARVRRASAGSG